MTQGSGKERVTPLVLVVDDDPELLSLVGLQLADSFEVIQASDGAECVRLAAQHSPDVILLDIMMPGMSGGEVLTALSQDPATVDIPVIFLSALAGVDDKVKGLQGGALDYITKPADPLEFVARVGAAARVRAKQLDVQRGTPGDPVTGLGHRRNFEDRLEQEVARARRISSPVAILLIDIDQMDTINEGYGKGFGDELLRGIGNVLAHKLRRSDAVFRYGGDEFSVLLPDAEAGTAYLAAERCRTAIASLHPDLHSLTVSIGVAELSAGRSAEELIAKAEIALFRAKESGGDRSWRADDPRRHGLNPIALAQELTEREWTILMHLSDRRTEQDIAGRMGIRPGTVRSHKARIRRKLHVAPDVRLSEFVRDNFRELIARLGPPKEGSVKAEAPGASR
jgi:diguanylate cyclase (GGDEF)-like protein